MNISSLLSLPFRYKPWRPYHLRLILSDLFGTSHQPEHDHITHIQAAIDWLCRAQDLRTNYPDAGGVSAGWSFEDGWLPSYPETSGYIIETFLAAAKVLDRLDLVERSQRIINWELSIQNDDGSFPGHFGEPGSRPVIFNTGQIMHGMIAGYTELKRSECLDAAVNAGRWLVSQQDDDGCWRRSVHNNVPHTYNTRATWALLRTAIISGDSLLKEAAIKNIEWALTQQTECGWFRTNAFTPDRIPFTHTIAYAIRGILECGLLVNEERYIVAATKAATALADVQRNDGWLAGTYDDNWSPAASYCCLTGLAQMSIIWKRLALYNNKPEFDNASHLANSFLKKHQRISGKKDASDGSIAGSSPIWGAYSRFEYPNWATKFYADALMMENYNITIPASEAMAVTQD